MHIIDTAGRAGVITEDRGDVLFARPADTSYLIEDSAGRTGVARAVLITATAWHKRPDGTLVGCWYDSPLNARITARIEA